MLCHLFHAFVYLHLSSPCFSFLSLHACMLLLSTEPFISRNWWWNLCSICLGWSSSHHNLLPAMLIHTLKCQLLITLRKLSIQKSYTLIECEESSDQKTSPPVNKNYFVDYSFMMIQSNAHKKTVDVTVVKKWKS